MSFLLSLELIEASNAMIAYRSNTGSGLFTVKVREWNSAGSGSWDSEIELLPDTFPVSGNYVVEAVVKFSPVSSKRIIIALNESGGLTAFVCTSSCTSPSSWTFSPVGNVWLTQPAIHSRRFDVEFETSTGDAIVVWATASTSGTQDLAYRVLPAASSSFTEYSTPVYYIDDTEHNIDLQYTWISLDRDPVSTSEELVVTGFDDTNKDINAWVWDGSAWGSQTEISTAALWTYGREALAVKYAADGSKAMVLAGNGEDGQINSKYWNGVSWTTLSTLDTDSADPSDVLWLTLKADPAKDDLQAVVTDTGADLHTLYWDGATWSITSHIDTAIDMTSRRPADFEWNPSGSTGKLVWDTDTTGTTLSQRTCSPKCTGRISTISTYAGSGHWLALYRNPTASDAVDILGGRLNSNFDIGSFYWDGTSYTNYGNSVITSDTTSTAYEAFSIAFQLA